MYKTKFHEISKNQWLTFKHAVEELDDLGGDLIFKHQPEFVPTSSLLVEWQGNMGYGLKSLIHIKKGTILGEYNGEVFSNEQSDRRKDRTYQIEFGPDHTLDAKKVGSIMRFANHSCDNNAYYTFSVWESELHVVVVAKKNIKPNEFINTHYGMKKNERFSFKGSLLCKCGSYKCVDKNNVRELEESSDGEEQESTETDEYSESEQTDEEKELEEEQHGIDENM